MEWVCGDDDDEDLLVEIYNWISVHTLDDESHDLKMMHGQGTVRPYRDPRPENRDQRAGSADRLSRWAALMHCLGGGFGIWLVGGGPMVIVDDDDGMNTTE